MRAAPILLSTLAVLVAGATPAPASPRGTAPLSGAVVRAFDPPDVEWGSGHRGVDLGATPGSLVVAPRDGVVTIAGEMAGRPIVVLSHGETRSTFEPVIATVAAGTRVVRGQTIGRLAAGHACPVPSCLHWGLKRGSSYLDPLSLLRGSVRLLSDAEAASVGG